MRSNLMRFYWVGLWCLLMSSAVWAANDISDDEIVAFINAYDQAGSRLDANQLNQLLHERFVMSYKDNFDQRNFGKTLRYSKLQIIQGLQIAGSAIRTIAYQRTGITAYVTGPRVTVKSKLFSTGQLAGQLFHYESDEELTLQKINGKVQAMKLYSHTYPDCRKYACR